MSQAHVDSMDDHNLGLDSSYPPNLHHLGQQHHMPFGLDDNTMSLDHNTMLAGIQANVSFPLGTNGTARNPLALTRWAQEGPDAPWHPSNLVTGTEDGGSQSVVSSLRGGSFIIPGQSNAVSLQQPSDSGYVTATYDCYDSSDANPDTQSIIEERLGMSMTDSRYSMADTISGDTIALGGSWVSPPSSTICPECKKEMKTRSEQRKHEQRHNKPFKCTVEGCSRQNEGFTSTNDLDRHTRSLHPESAITGNRYRCPFGSCASRNKIWPRADNFKAHLKRLHKFENLSNDVIASYIHNPSISHREPRNSSQQETMSDFSEYASPSNGQSDNWAHYTEVSNMAPLEPLTEERDEDDLSLPGGQQEIATLPNAHLMLPPEPYHTTRSSSPNPTLPPSPIQQITLDESTIGNPTSPPMQELPAEVADKYSAEDLPASGHAQHQQFETSNTCSDRVPKIGSVPNTPDPSEHIDASIAVPSETREGTSSQSGSPGQYIDNLALIKTIDVEKLVEFIQSRGLLEKFREVLENFGQEKQNFELIEPTETENRETTSQDRTHICSTCEKRFRRRCELKKHEKRHEKPFACTTTGCPKRFGSKNDWRRHENTQHATSDKWRCDEESCNEIYFRQETFENHLENVHKILDQANLKAKVDRCHIATTNNSHLCGGGINQTAAEVKHKGLSGQAQSPDQGDGILKNIGEWGRPIPLLGDKESSGEDLDEACSGSSSVGDAKTQHHFTQEGADLVPGRSKSKRKRADGNNVSNSKKGKTTNEMTAVCVRCCKCADLITLSLLRCHYPCEHEPCADCKRVQ